MTLRLGDTAPNFQQQSSEGIIDFMNFLEIAGDSVFTSCRLYSGLYH